MLRHNAEKIADVSLFADIMTISFIHRGSSTMCAANAILLQNRFWPLTATTAHRYYIVIPMPRLFFCFSVITVHYIAFCNLFGGISRAIYMIFFFPNPHFHCFSFVGTAFTFCKHTTVYSSKYTTPTLAMLTPTRPCFLHRVDPLSHRRIGGTVGCGCGSRGRGCLIVGLVTEITEHLLVGPRLLRGRLVLVDTFIVVLVAIKRH